MKNGLPYMPKELFWEAMQDIAQNTTLMSGDPLPKHVSFQKQVQGSSLTVHAVQEVHLAAPTNVGMSYPLKTPTFSPKRPVAEIAGEFAHLQPQPNKNRSRLSGSAKALTFGSQTGRGSGKGCLIRRTLDSAYADLIKRVHSLVQSTEILPDLGFQVLILEGQELNQHRTLSQEDRWRCSVKVRAILMLEQWFGYRLTP